jgi:hypothetical protein
MEKMKCKQCSQDALKNGKSKREYKDIGVKSVSDSGREAISTEPVRRISTNLSSP